MGLWERTGSTKSVNRNAQASDLMPIENNATRVSYNHGSGASEKVVGIDGLRRLVDQRLPDDKARAKMGHYGTLFAKNAGLYVLQEGIKIIPGGAAFSKIMADTLNDVKEENLRNEVIKMVGNQIYNETPTKYLNGDQKTIEEAKNKGKGSATPSVSSKTRFMLSSRFAT